jgi:MFS transporter (putative signal transducer)
VDFTLLQWADAIVAGLGGLIAGQIAQHLGYAHCFGLAASLAVPGVAAPPTILHQLTETKDKL